MDPAVLTNLVFGLGSVAVAAFVALIVGRRRGLDQVEDRSDKVSLQLRDDLMARVELLEKANREKDLTIAAQNNTIAGLTAKTATLEGKVEELETALARERRVTASMRGETA